MRGKALGLAVTVALAACGGTALESSPEGGPREDAGAIDGTPGFGSSSGSGSSSGVGGSSSSGSSSGSLAQDGGLGLDATMPVEDGSTIGPPVDGGYYCGDGSFWVEGAPTPVGAGAACNLLTSDVAAVYCAQNAASNLALSSSGSATALGSAVNASTIVFDDTYAYWADMTTVGTIMKAPKAGGGSATVLASDTSPTAIAVDANSVYWADQGGYIKSVPK